MGNVHNRNRITKDEAIQTLIDKQPPRQLNKLCDFLHQDNVKEFNRVLVSRAFLDHMDTHKPFSLDDEEECLKECAEFFELCYKHDIIPNVASLAVYLRTDTRTMYENMANISSPVNRVLNQAIAICHALQEEGTLHGNINPVLFMYLSKNYYGLKDQSSISLTTTINDKTINNNQTMKVIQEQLALENKDNENSN